MKGVPVNVVAKVYGKDACWVRAGILKGWLPIGIATRNGIRVTEFAKGKRTNFYISPKLLYEHTGFKWEESHEEN